MPFCNLFPDLAPSQRQQFKMYEEFLYFDT